jgi:hypothetical protein
MKYARKEVKISFLISRYTRRNLLMSITLWVMEFIGIAHKNLVTIRNSQRTEYAMLIKGNNWYRF